MATKLGKQQRQWRNERYQHTQYHSQQEYSNSAHILRDIRGQMERGELTEAQAAIEIRCRVGHSPTMAQRAAARLRWEIENAKSRT